MNWTPCYHLIEDARQCGLQRDFPHDCPRCSKYLPGRDRAEQTRVEVWISGLTAVEIEQQEPEPESEPENYLFTDEDFDYLAM